MKVRAWAVGALAAGMIVVGPVAASAHSGGGGGGNGGSGDLLGGLLGGGGHDGGLLGGILGDGCNEGELVTVAGGAGLVGVNLDGLDGLNLNHGLLGHDDGQLIGVGGQSGGDSHNALINTGDAQTGNGLLGISLGGCD
ncbi:MAG: hypothetical protein ACRDJU_07920 [Actinomycetota bacterium]